MLVESNMDSGWTWERRGGQRTWAERLNGSLNELDDFINNRDAPGRSGPITWKSSEEFRAEIDKAIGQIRQHRDTVDATIDELRRRRAEPG